MQSIVELHWVFSREIFTRLSSETFSGNVSESKRTSSNLIQSRFELTHVLAKFFLVSWLLHLNWFRSSQLSTSPICKYRRQSNFNHLSADLNLFFFAHAVHLGLHLALHVVHVAHIACLEKLEVLWLHVEVRNWPMYSCHVCGIHDAHVLIIVHLSFIFLIIMNTSSYL